MCKSKQKLNALKASSSVWWNDSDLFYSNKRSKQQILFNWAIFDFFFGCEMEAILSEYAPALLQFRSDWWTSFWKQPKIPSGSNQSMIPSSFPFLNFITFTIAFSEKAKAMCGQNGFGACKIKMDCWSVLGIKSKLNFSLKYLLSQLLSFKLGNLTNLNVKFKFTLFPPVSIVYLSSYKLKSNFDDIQYVSITFVCGKVRCIRNPSVCCDFTRLQHRIET